MSDSSKTLWNDYKYGVHISNLDYLSFYQSFTVIDMYRCQPEDKGVALATWIGLNSIIAGVEYVNRSNATDIARGNRSNISAGAAFLRVFDSLLGESNIGKYVGLMVGNNWFIFKARIGYFRNTDSRASRKELWLFQIGVIY